MMMMWRSSSPTLPLERVRAIPPIQEGPPFDQQKQQQRRKQQGQSKDEEKRSERDDTTLDNTDDPERDTEILKTITDLLTSKGQHGRHRQGVVWDHHATPLRSQRGTSCLSITTLDSLSSRVGMIKTSSSITSQTERRQSKTKELGR